MIPETRKNILPHFYEFIIKAWVDNTGSIIKNEGIKEGFKRVKDRRETRERETARRHGRVLDPSKVADEPVAISTLFPSPVRLKALDDHHPVRPV